MVVVEIGQCGKSGDIKGGCCISICFLICYIVGNMSQVLWKTYTISIV